MSMDPSKRSDDDEKDQQFVAKKTYQELEADNEALREKIRALEAQLGVPSTLDEVEKEQTSTQEADPDATMASQANDAPADATDAATTGGDEAAATTEE